MNKRQYKKKVKKTENNLLSRYNSLVKNMMNILRNTIKEIPNMIANMEENIRTIDNDKFEECLNKLDDIRLKEKVIAIRNGEKVNWF